MAPGIHSQMAPGFHSQIAPKSQHRKSWTNGGVDSTSGADIHAQNDWAGELADSLSTGQVDGDGFRSFKVVGIASDQVASPTGMKEDILLLSWLIVLLRTREGSRLSYGWSYKD